MSPVSIQIAPSRSALILYGTETGNSEDVAYEFSQTLGRLHFRTETRELDAAPLSSLLRHDIVVFALSTTGQGDFPSNARKFWSNLLRRKLTANSLTGLVYASVGLCDSSYPKFNLAGRKLHKRLQQLGATSLLNPCEADEQGEEGTEGVFLSWLPAFERELLDRFPLAPGQEPISASEKLPSTWLLHEVPDKDTNLGSFASHKESSTVSSRASTPLSFSVALEHNERVTSNDHWQDVRLLSLVCETPVEYLPGDALAIRPQNQPEDVEQILDLLGWQHVADRNLILRQNEFLMQNEAVHEHFLDAGKSFTLRELITNHLDINAIPRRSFFAKIAHLTTDEMQRDRALEFTDPQYLDEYFDYATRPRRSILEVLQEFHTVRIPWQEAINIFPTLRPRQFSIASGGASKSCGRTFELLVAIVKYRTVIKRVREGVCTKYLARLPVGAKFEVTLQTEGRFHLNGDTLARPHLLIGGGTGVAPLRSIIQEKLQIAAEDASSVLIFGCRSSNSDYFFSSEWQDIQEKQPKSLKVVTAFSRDQSSKVYIQDRLQQNSLMIQQFLEDPRAVIIVCGSSGAMPKAVRLALRDIIAKQLQSDSAAETTLLRFEKEDRYKQETW